MVAGINRVPTGGSDNPSARVQIANSVNAALSQLATAQTNIATNTAAITANAAAAVGGDLTGTMPNPTVAVNKIDNTKLAQMATKTIKGNAGAGTANAADLTATQVKALLGGTLAQAPVITETGALATGTTTMPATDAIPTNTQGDQYMSATITPTNASSILIIDVVWNGATSAAAASFFEAALYQDATANALAAVIFGAGQNSMFQLVFRHQMVAGTTASTTFKVRAGSGAVGTTTFNGSSGARRGGGVLASSITITEYLP